MCYSCYLTYGKPKIINKAVEEAVRLIINFDDKYSIVGDIHAILDDWNIEDRHIDSAMLRINNKINLDQQSKAEKKLINIFKKLSLVERATVLAANEEMIHIF